MNHKTGHRWAGLFLAIILLPIVHAPADGGYFGSDGSVAVSADQRAIIIRNGEEISMTFTTGYTGDGGDFCWIIPTPVAPRVGDVGEGGEGGETAFRLLDEYTSPQIIGAHARVAVSPWGELETEAAGGNGPGHLVTVHDTVILEHYEVSILGAADAVPLLSWLRENGYQVNAESRDVLDSYIEREWAFVAVKLNPAQRRRYENEFLPPFTVRYRYGGIHFPLLISSVSTARTAGITLYVIADNPVATSSLPIATLEYEETLSEWFDPQRYIEGCIRKTVGSEGFGLAVMWRGELHRESLLYQESMAGRRGDIENIELLETAFPSGSSRYLTRLDTRIEPAAMTEDIELGFHSYGDEPERLQRAYAPEPFRVRILAYGGYGSELTAAARDGRVDAVRRLLDAGAHLDTRDDSGLTALMWAFRKGYPPIVRMLLDAGADVNIRDADGRTLLHRAALEGRGDAVRALLEADADVDARSADRMTALFEAIEGDHAGIVEILIEAGADVNGPAGDGFNALTWAARRGSAAIVSELLHAGAAVSGKDERGRTPLVEAAGGGNAEVVSHLLRAGADVNARSGETALMRAARSGRAAVVRILIDAGADVNAVQENGQTALTIARFWRHHDVSRLLKKAGAARVDDRMYVFGLKFEPAFFTSRGTAANGLLASFLLRTFMSSPGRILPWAGLDLFLSMNAAESPADYRLIGLELNTSIIVASVGLSVAWETTPAGGEPYLGFRLRFLDMPPFLFRLLSGHERTPLLDLGFDVLPMTVRWNLKTGEPLFTVGILSVHLGHTHFAEAF